MPRQRRGRKPSPKKESKKERGKRPSSRDEGRKGRGRSRSARARAHPPPGPKFARVSKSPKGFAFLLVPEPGRDVFVPPEEAAWLLNDDLVEYRVERRRGRPCAEIRRVVERAQTELVGQVYRDRGEWELVSLEGDSHLIVHPPRDLRAGDWALARFEQYPTREHPAQMRVEENLGPELLPKHDVLLASARFGLPRSFGADALEEALMGKLKARKAVQELGNRVDLRHIPLVTIDGEDAKDFDDAVAVLRNVGGSPFVLYVAIADVSHFVTPGSALDQEALRRGTSVYFPGTCLPMLPEGLSNDLCSLVPKTERLAFTAEITLDREGNPTGCRFYESLIKTAARLTYHQVQAYLDDPKRLPENNAAIGEALKSARVLFRLMLKRREERGALDFELPEAKIQVDPEGWPIQSGRVQRLESHRLIEEFMIAANREVARKLRDAPALFRVHEPPAPAALDEVNERMRSLGISQRMEDLTPKSFARILEATRGIKGAPTLHQSILRLLKQAQYRPEPLGHFGLALDDYTHFTSPIRRYPDLVVHRALKALIAGDEWADKGEEGNSLATLGQRLSEQERRAMEAERFTVKRKACWFLRNRLDECFDGIICGVTARGIFVEATQIAIEGFVPIDSLGERYEFDERRGCLRQRPGHGTLSVGDPFNIRVEEVSLADHQITFAPADE